VEYMCTKFGVDSSSLLERRHTDTQTQKVADATDHFTDGSAAYGVGN